MLRCVLSVDVMALNTGLASVGALTAGGHGAGTTGGFHMMPPFGFLLVLLLIGTIGYFVVKSARSGTRSAGTTPDQALETLRRRYANGEIDDEEFQTRKERLVR
jgi:putative membrane protein